MTKENEKDFQDAKLCYLCNKEFTLDNYKVRDHDHTIEFNNYRGAAHNNCNLNYHSNLKIPVVIHNLKGYDSHFIIQELGKFINQNKTYKDKDGNEKLKKNNLNVIAKNSEQFICIEYNNVKFIDSFQFMSTSLDSLVKNNTDENDFNKTKENLKNTATYFKKIPDNKLQLILKKGFFCYDWFDNIEKLKYDKLPTKDNFYNQLNNEDISEENYKHVQEVWSSFNCKTFEDYHDIYLKTDVLLLCDVFNNFRKTCKNIYQLDPINYITSPSLSLDAMLKYTDTNLELLEDVNMYKFFELGVRGGYSNCLKRYAKANNKYMKDYNPKERSSYIIYLDANNLYGWAMSQPLPVSGFKWMSKSEFETNKVLENYTDESEMGYTLEVDLIYPDYLHNLHFDFALAPQNIQIEDKFLSNYQKKLKEKLEINSSNEKKLITSLHTKRNYVVNIKVLKLYLELGMVIGKIHRIVKYKQEVFLKSYIDKNTNERKNSKNEFEKDFYKLMNNSVFGKTLESVRNRIDYKLCYDKDLFLKYEKSNLIKHINIINENLIGVQLHKKKVLLDKPIFLGQTILDNAKFLMYEFYYKYIIPKYKRENVNLLMTDCDSLLLEIFTEDIYEDMKQDKHLFDLSEYDKNDEKFGFMNDNTNKKTIGKMKDEVPNDVITEFVGLRSKMYSFTTEKQKETKKAKGIKKSVVKQEILFNQYKQILFNSSFQKNNQKGIRSFNHNLKTLDIEKISLSSYNDKCHIFDDGINSYCFGHKDFFGK